MSKDAARRTWTVHKFGGASVQNAEGIRNAARVLEGCLHAGEDHLLVVVSAMGKTTSALEEAVRMAWSGQRTAAQERVDAICGQHRRTAAELGLEPGDALMQVLEREMGGLERNLYSALREGDFDAFYDAVVHSGEVFSTLLLAAFLQRQGWNAAWHDTRQLVFTDNTHREARPDWARSTAAIRQHLGSEPASVQVVQGFIGSGERGQPVTLGLEGSDFSAAIFAQALQARSVTLWKNVPGVFSADPHEFPAAVLLDRLSYREVFQMANYGAKVIHPKTMRPLEEAGIPLRVRSFNDPAHPGTLVDAEGIEAPLPPIRVRLKDLTLISLTISDLSYFNEKHVERVFRLLGEFKAKAYLTEIGLMSFAVAVGVEPNRRDSLICALAERYRVRYNEGMHLLTIRHYQADSALELESQYTVYLEQRNRLTLQLLYKESAPNP
jgi:aspartate kinase